MVFAAVLHQLTLAVEPHNATHPEFAETPFRVSPLNTFASPQYRNPNPFRQPIPSTGLGFSAQPIPKPLSPTTSIQVQRAAHHGDSTLSTVSSCPSTTSDRARLSVSGPAPSAASGRDEASSETSSDILPTFTSEPADLVTIGSLQLVSMGAEHPGAAELARLLHSLGDIKDLVESNRDPSLLAKSLTFPTTNITLSMFLTGLGLPSTPNVGGVHGQYQD